MANDIEKLPKGNPPKYPVSQLILVWGKQNPHMGPRDIVDPQHPAYDADIDDPDIWDASTYYGQKFESMVRSMLIEVDGMLQGIRVPISVAKDGSQDGYVVAGRWRTLAGREAEKRAAQSGQSVTIQAPFMYVPLTDAAMKRQMVLENMNGNRQLKPTRKAAYVAILESHGASREEIMTACGVTSWQAVENIKKLNELAPEVKELVDSGSVTQTEARKIADKPQQVQKKIAEDKKNGQNNDSNTDDNEAKRVSPGDMRRIQEAVTEKKIQVDLGEFLNYFFTGDLNKLNQEVRGVVFDALKPKKRGPSGKKAEKVDSARIAWELQKQACDGKGWKKRAAIMDSIQKWEDEGQASCNNPDYPDYHCANESWYTDMNNKWRKAYENRKDKAQSKVDFLKEWIRSLNE